MPNYKVFYNFNTISKRSLINGFTGDTVIETKDEITLDTIKDDHELKVMIACDIQTSPRLKGKKIWSLDFTDIQPA